MAVRDDSQIAFFHEGRQTDVLEVGGFLVSQTTLGLTDFTKVLSKTGLLEKTSNCLTFLLKINANDTHQPIDKTGKVTAASLSSAVTVSTA